MSDGEGQLPWLTQVFLGMVDNVVPFWIGVFILVALALATYAILSASPGGRRIKESVLLGVPIMGRLYRSGILARIAEAMALLIGAGCQMGQCLRLSAGASGSEKMKLDCDVLAGEIEEGVPIMEAGHACRMIPRLFLYSVQLGSQRNELQDNLLSLGQMYGEQTRCLQANLQAILLPAMIILVGGFVATMILAMFLPMVSIISALM
jgi:type IV pilus assembly protein PilC